MKTLTSLLLLLSFAVFGQEKIEGIYDRAERFKEGYSVTLVQKDGKQILINKKGKKIIGGGSISIYDVRDGTYQIRNGSNTYFVDKDGKRIEK